MDQTTVILISAFVLLIGAIIIFAVIWSKRLEARLQEQTNKALQQSIMEMTTVDLVNKNIGELRQDVAERLGRIDEAQRNINELGASINDLKTVLKGNQTRGRYGEMQLKALLENSFDNTSGIYALQHPINNGKVKPDAVIFLPEPEKLLCIDSKFPFSSYEELFKEDLTEERRNDLKTTFKNEVKKHITDVKNKYILDGETSPYAVMFIPNDGIFYFIHLEAYDLVEYARSIEGKYNKNFRFTLTTNGMLVDDEVIDFLNREMSNVVLSLDGRPEVHDHFRRDYSGNGSYEKIVPKFLKLVEKRGGKNYYVRGTYTHNNTDFVNDILHMADLGFSELSMEPVVCPPGDPYALTENDMPKLLSQYELLAKEMLKREDEGRPITFYHYMLDLKNGPCIYKRIAGCGSGTEYMAVTPWGDLYPCHQFVGDPKYLLGNIWDGIKNTAVQDEFRACNAYSREECRDCWAKLYCSGGCAANSYHATGSVRGVYAYGCELFKKRIECAVMLGVARAEKE